MRKIVGAAVISLAVACDGGPTGPTVDVPISGRVLDAATGAGVPNATVALGDSTAVTDTAGYYSLVVPYLGTFEAVVDGRAVGRARVTGSRYRGDFLIYPAFCVARYGTVTDARTLRPIAGATVSLSTKRIMTEKDGWYRLDLACSTGPAPPGGTAFIYISHPDYERLDAIVGRGIAGAYRNDYELQRR